MAWPWAWQVLFLSSIPTFSIPEKILGTIRTMIRHQHGHQHDTCATSETNPTPPGLGGAELVGPELVD